MKKKENLIKNVLSFLESGTYMVEDDDSIRSLRETLMSLIQENKALRAENDCIKNQAIDPNQPFGYQNIKTLIPNPKYKAKLRVSKKDSVLGLYFHIFLNSYNFHLNVLIFSVCRK